MNDPRPFWTLAQLARVLRMSPCSVRRALLRGDLCDYVQISERTIRVDPEDFREWARRRKTATRSPGVRVRR